MKISEIVDDIDNLEELEGFASTLRAPPTGAIVKQATKEDWRIIAMKKIELQRRAAK